MADKKYRDILSDIHEGMRRQCALDVFIDTKYFDYFMDSHYSMDRRIEGEGGVFKGEYRQDNWERIDLAGVRRRKRMRRGGQGAQAIQRHFHMDRKKQLVHYMLRKYSE